MTKIKKKKILILCGIVLFLVFIIGGIWSSYHLIEVRSYQIENGPELKNIKIAVISDLHENPISEKIVSEMENQHPNVIFVVGDLLNRYSETSDTVVSLIKRLSGIAPVYYSWGNHELTYMNAGHMELQSELEAAGAIVLNREFIDVNINGTLLRIGGLYEYAFALDAENSTNPDAMDPEVYHFFFFFQDTDAYKIMLSHRPESFVLGEAAETWQIDLGICGHTHGGQIVLPLFGGLYAPEQGLFPEYVHGVYQKGNLTFAITSGLGSQKDRVPRFNNPPEIMVLEFS